MRYIAFTDESNVTAARYRSICAFSFPEPHLSSVTQELAGVLQGCEVAEFKWQYLSSAKYRFCALALIDKAVEGCCRAQWRLDTVVWDTRDARHSIQNRHDGKNFERMFFHLLRNVMSRREPNAAWRVFPDEKHDVDWSTVRDCLKSVGEWRRYSEQTLLDVALSEQFFRLEQLQPVESHVEPSCQLADLFAGVAAFSRTNAERYGAWRATTTPQGSLLPVPLGAPFSNSERERFPALERLAERCRSTKLGVSLETKGYLRTLDPKNPINFWQYHAQHHQDRAPVR